MSNLHQQFDEISAELDLLASSEQNKNMIEQFERLIESLEPQIEQIKQILDQEEIITPISAEYPDFAEQIAISKNALKSAIKTFDEAWQKDQSGVDGKRPHKQLVDTLEETNQGVTTTLNQAWQQFIASQRQSFEVAPAELENAKVIDSNRNIVQQFEGKRESFNNLAPVIPSNSNTPRDIKRLSEELRQIKSQIKFDFPQEVARFYKSLDSSGAPIDLLTETVLKYLRENNLLDNFRIKRR
jgi:hypothetical protein